MLSQTISCVRVIIIPRDLDYRESPSLRLMWIDNVVFQVDISKEAQASHGILLIFIQGFSLVAFLLNCAQVKFVIPRPTHPGPAGF